MNLYEEHAVKNAADFKNEQKVRQNQLDDGLRKLTTTREGRTYLRWLLRIGKVNQQPFSGSDAQTNFNCGQLNVGHQIFAHLMKIAPQAYILMQKEEREEYENSNSTGNHATRNNSNTGSTSYD